MSEVRQKVMAIAEELIGSPCIRYVPDHPELGQSPIDGFDCSGFVRYVFKEAGLQIPDYISRTGDIRQVRHTNEFFDYYGVLVHPRYAQHGDLVFFSREGWSPTHIGIYSGDQTFIHAPGKDGQEVLRESIYEESIKPHLRDGHPVLYETNPIGYKALVKIHNERTYRVHQRVV